MITREEIKELRKKFAGKGYIIKSEGYWKDDTQLIYRSELLDETNMIKTKELMFIGSGYPRVLPTALRFLLAEHILDDGVSSLPSGITYNDDPDIQRFKIPNSYLPVFGTQVFIPELRMPTVELEPQKIQEEPIAVTPEPISFPSTMTAIDTEPIVETKPTEQMPEVINEDDPIVRVQRMYAERPYLEDDVKFFANLANESVSDYLLMSINSLQAKMMEQALTNEELSKLIINLLILNKNK